MNISPMSRRHFLQAAATTAGAATLGNALAACGSTSSSGSTSTVTINHWDLLVSQGPWINNEIKLFQQAHPTIKINKTTKVTDTYSNLFSLAVQSNNEPDFFLLPDPPKLNDMVTRGWLMPLDKWANASWRAQYPPSSFFEGNNMFNGKLYSAPFGGQNSSWLQLYIHNGIFKQAGIVNADGSVKIPQTWDDVTAAADAISKKIGGSTYGMGFGNGQNFILAWWLEIFTRGAGSGASTNATFQDYRTGKWGFGTNRAYMDFVQLLLAWKKKGYIYPNSMSSSDEEARAFFERGKFGMTVGGVWNQVEWSQHNFTDYSLTTLPSPSTTPQGYFYNQGGGKMWGISNKTKHPEEAWAWFNWLQSPETGKRWVQAGEDISTFVQDNNPAYVKFKPFAEYVAASKFSLLCPDPAKRNPQTAYVVQNTVSPNINDVIAGIYTGQIGDPQSAFSALADRHLVELNKGITQAQQQGHKVSFSDFVFPDWDPTKPYVMNVSS